MHERPMHSPGLALLLIAAALAMFLFRCGNGEPFTEVPDDGSLELRIDINRAGRAEMEALPGVGPVLAGRILRHRDEYGPFETTSGLTAVRGIGEGLVRSLTPYVKAGDGGRSVGPLDDEVGGGEEGRVDGRR